MSIKIENIDLHKGEYIAVRFDGSCEHSLTIMWKKEDELPTVSGPFNCKSKKYKISIYGMESVEKDDEN